MTEIQNVVHSGPVLKMPQVDDQFKFRELPQPTGKYPYRTRFTEEEAYCSATKMVFHMVGDTGSVREPQFQKLIAGEMLLQLKNAVFADDKPLFLYHLGDVVYKYGEANGYAKQFFEPYAGYPNTVYAIPGNHDSDINPESSLPYNSLDAFIAVFCDTKNRTIPFSNSAVRKSNTQPNVYWTFETPLATIIGLYSNVPKYGTVKSEQKAWFINELKAAAPMRQNKALIVCVHHAPYSADVNHGSSANMIELLESSFSEAGVRPDIVFSGHVHNYQRFHKTYKDGTVVPYIVAGGGGYDELHPIALLSDPAYDGSSPLFAGVKLEAFCDDRHGFLKISISKKDKGLSLHGAYYSLPHSMLTNVGEASVLTDEFEMDLVR